MKMIPFTEFRRHASQLLSRVEEGETFLVLRHGRPIAEVTPVTEDRLPKPSWKRPGLRLKVKGAALARAILEERRREGVL
jgi:prevent-host-death family protein